MAKHRRGSARIRRSTGDSFERLVDRALAGIPSPFREHLREVAIVANKISLFRFPLEEDFPNPDDLAAEVRATVIHELAHHLGIDDDRLDELGVG